MKKITTWLRQLDKHILSVPLRIRRLVAGGLLIVIILIVGGVLIAKKIHSLPHKLTITSTAFAEGKAIPALYTCDGENLNPPFKFDHLPAGTKSLALYIEDQTMSSHPVHWLTWNIPAANLIIMEGIRPAGTVSRSFAGNFGYSGPCPPAGEKHTYVVHAYAVSTAQLSINSSANLADFLKSISSVTLDEAKLSATYQRVKK